MNQNACVWVLFCLQLAALRQDKRKLFAAGQEALKIAGFREYFMNTALRKNATGASMCVQCGRCEAHCPQHIPIREKLKEAQRVLEGPVYKIGSKVIKAVMKY